MDEPACIATVILENSLKQPLDYLIPESLKQEILVGTCVEIPLRNSVKKGTVIELKSGKSSPYPLKPINKVLSSKPFLTDELFQLALWMSQYYCTPLSDILKTMIPSAIRKGTPQKERNWISRAQSKESIAEKCSQLRQSAPAQAAILNCLLESKQGIFLTELIAKTNASPAAVESLIKKGLLKKEKILVERSPLKNADYFPTKPKPLSGEQDSVLKKICASLTEDSYATHLLFGVTGSGKTEVYLHAIQKALEQQKTALMLVPEITLTPQTIERFRSRFEGHIAVLHHRLGEGERQDEWKKIHRGDASIVIGARSAIFCPLPRLGLIIIDEEHDSSYKQSDAAPTYHARDIAVMRATFCKATVILGSATPSLESYFNALKGKYQLSALAHRPNAAAMPTIRLIDMRKEYDKSKGFTIFSEALLSAIEKRLKAGEQTILFLNRRGYHTVLLCTNCGTSIKCPHCEVTLTFHKGENALSCHLCGYRNEPPPSHCPACQEPNPLKFKGVGTEQVEAALYAIFPECKVLRMDADSTSQKGSHQKIYRDFRASKADILIGTQMVAKGLHFPGVTLVGVLNSDMSLNIPDFRSGEVTFQLITQVAGRSGRSALQGEVLIQTCIPENQVIQDASQQDYNRFYEHEIETRKLFSYPPFIHLVKVRFTGPELHLTTHYANDFRNELIQILSSDCSVTPVEAAGHAKINSQFRMHFLIKGPRISILNKAIQAVNLPFNRNVKILIDINPISTFF